MLEFMQRKRQEDGFTLIELLIVIVILGILAGIVVFAVGGITDRGQKSACDTERKTAETAIEAYYAKNGSYAAATGTRGWDNMTTSENRFLRDAPAHYTYTGGGNMTAASPCT